MVGVLPGIREGMEVRCTGEWHDDPRYGRQFRAERYTEMVPATAEGVAAYLGSGIIRGIGPKFAERIVATLGVGALEIIAKAPERLVEVEGVGAKRVKQIVQTLSERRGAQEAMLFLHGLGLKPNMAAKI